MDVFLNNFSNSTSSIGVTNSGSFVAKFTIDYIDNGELVTLDSGSITSLFYRELTIPSFATNIHILVSIYTGFAWIPLYNNNLSSSITIKLELSGTIFSPKYKLITEAPPIYNIKALNNGAFDARFSVKYSFDTKDYTINSETMTVKISRTISIPQSATNILITAEADNIFSWKPFYSKTLNSSQNLNLTFSGTSLFPKCTESPSLENLLDNGFNYLFDYTTPPNASANPNNYNYYTSIYEYTQ